MVPIVERHHRTIKAMAERGGITPQLAVFWYNFSPRSGQNAASVPHVAIYKYGWRHPSVCSESLESEESTVKIGEEVWVKPAHSLCTTRWGKGVVTDINSGNNISVDGMPRHILDIRRVVADEDSDGGSEYDSVAGGSEEEHSEEVVVQPVEEVRRNPGRSRRPPDWLADYAR